MDKTTYSVSQITRYLKEVIDNDEILRNVIIKGEISNYKVHSSGHIYFTLKDDEAKIKCVLFKSYSLKLKFIPEDGMSVLAYGSISIYGRDGQYQLYCTKLEPDGFGSLYLAFEQLKERLLKEGLFNQENKKKLPLFPRRIGVVTSSTGAVIRDIVNVAARRFRGVNILLYPAKVQGEGAAESIVEGIKFFNQRDDIDVIIIGRGGGSIEELWAFNEEIVARAIFESRLPIISAVGHETDTTISDYVADVRASTPSHAAEIAVPRFEDLKFKIKNYNETLYKYLINNVKHRELVIDTLYQRLMNYSPNNIIMQNIQYIDNLHNRMINTINKRVTFDRNNNHLLTTKLKNLGNRLITTRRNKFSYLVGKIDALSPLKTLTRGYAFVQKDDEIIKSIESVEIDDILMLKLCDGSLRCRVEEKMEVNLWEMN